MRNISIILSAIAMFAGLSSKAQTERDNNLVLSEKYGWEYEIKSGVNIGGVAPMPLPREIRSIDYYNPKLNGVLEGVVTKWFGENRSWGVSGGIKFEEKGMKTKAVVKNYYTEVSYGKSTVNGYYYGAVATNFNATYLTIPVSANYRLSNRWKVRAGLFTAFKLDGNFNGYVSEGYLRQGSPTGEKISFEGDGRAAYDFSKDLRTISWGADCGVTWQAYRHFSLNADLSWGFNDIFKNRFNTISFDMYPVYMNISIGYKF